MISPSREKTPSSTGSCRSASFSDIGHPELKKITALSSQLDMVNTGMSLSDGPVD